MVEGEELVEEVCDVFVGQAHAFELVGIVLEPIAATAALEVQQGRDGLVGAHERVVPVVAVVGRGLCNGGGDFVSVVHGIALSLCPGQVSAQSVNLPLHFGMLGALSHALKVGFDLAFELEADAARAALERVLDDIASELERVEKEQVSRVVIVV